MSVSVSVCLYQTQNNRLINLKLEHVVLYGNSSDEFDIGLCLIKIKVIA